MSVKMTTNRVLETDLFLIADYAALALADDLERLQALSKVQLYVRLFKGTLTDGNLR